MRWQHEVAHCDEQTGLLRTAAGPWLHECKSNVSQNVYSTVQKNWFRQNMHDSLGLMQQKLSHGVLAKWLLVRLWI